MVGVDIITGKFIAWVDVLSRIKFRSAVRDADKHIGIARVIDEGKRPSAPSTVQGDCVTDLHNCDPLGSPGSLAGFAQGDALAAKLPDLLTRVQAHIREQPFALDGTFSD
jgi:hypothetical protein